MHPVLVTGATGFVGSRLAQRLAQGKWPVRAAVRRDADALPFGIEVATVGEIDGTTDWRSALDGVATVIHCAARAHILHETNEDPAASFRRVNTDGTLNLARQALDAGVSRFVFVSTIGVLGNETIDRPFRSDDPPAPGSVYAASKLEAEEGLHSLVRSAEMKVVIVRPPLVYGPGAPGNLSRMLRWLAMGMPLPLGAIENRRSLVGLDNLVDFLVRCAEHPAAANRTFLVSDGEDVSTPALLRAVGEAAGLRVRLFPVPPRLLTLVARIVGKPELAQRLCGSLQVDASEAIRLLDWVPPMSLSAGLRLMGEQYKIEARS
jgi:nucleoside-diphosphate-sugar epimerase